MGSGTVDDHLPPVFIPKLGNPDIAILLSENQRILDRQGTHSPS